MRLIYSENESHITNLHLIFYPRGYWHTVGSRLQDERRRSNMDTMTTLLKNKKNNKKKTSKYENQEKKTYYKPQYIFYKRRLCKEVNSSQR